MNCIVAFDCGTTSMKAAAFSLRGQVLGSVDASYTISHPHPGWAEQDPAHLWDVLCQSSRQLLATASIAPSAVAGVCFVAPWKNIIPIDGAGQVLHPSLIWMDGRAGKQAAELNARLGRFIGTGQEYWPRLMWLKDNRPDVWAAARQIIGLNSYFKWRATGLFTTEPSDDFIHGSTPNAHAQRAEMLTAAGLATDIDMFPPPTAATDVIGKLTTAAGTQLGLRAGTPVVGGYGDIPAIAVGSGRARVGDSHIYLGTSSWFLNVAAAATDPVQPHANNTGHRASARPDATPAPLTATLTATTDAHVYPLQSGCLAKDWIIEQTYAAEKQQLGPGIHQFIDDQVSQVPPGSQDLLATHWLTGELPPFSKEVHGVYLNLTATHDRRHMVRAMLESVAYTHRLSIETHERATGRPVPLVRAVGGGAVSDIWMQILADVLQLTVEVPPAPRLTGARGGFACAAVGLGLLPDLDSLDTLDASSEQAKTVTRFSPQPGSAQTYDRLYRVYTQVHDQVAPLFQLLQTPENPAPPLQTETR